MLRLINFNKVRQLYEYDIIDSKSVPIGFAQLSLIPTKSDEMPEGFESNVYYEIKPEHRGMGYGTQALKDLIKESGNHGLVRLVATVNEDNQASVKVIEKCGGKLIDRNKTIQGKPVLKYQL